MPALLVPPNGTERVSEHFSEEAFPHRRAGTEGDSTCCPAMTASITCQKLSTPMGAKGEQVGLWGPREGERGCG